MSVRAKLALFERKVASAKRDSRSENREAPTSPTVPSFIVVKPSPPRRHNFWSTTFLRKGSKSPTNVVSDDDDDDSNDVETLRMQVANLRRHVNILDGDTGRDELLKLVKIKDQESKQKDEQMKNLNAKLSKIQQGLIAIDRERKTLTERAKTLEQEKAGIEQEMCKREKEIISLTKRCAEEGEKAKESSRLRTANEELSRELDELRLFVTTRSAAESVVAFLRRDLEDSEQARIELSKRLERINEDNERVSHKLLQCMASQEKLNEEKQEWEEERRRLMQRAEDDLEQQRVSHVKAVVSLKEDLRVQQEKLLACKKVADEKDLTIENLRAQLSDAKESSRPAGRSFQSLFPFHQGEVEQLRTKHERELSAHTAKLKATLAESKKSSAEKDRVIEELQQQLSQLESISSVELENSESKLEKRVTSLLADHQRELGKLQVRYDEKLVDMERREDEKISRIKQSIERENDLVKSLKEELYKAKTTLEEVRRAEFKLAQRIALLTSNHQSEIEEIRFEYENELATVKASLFAKQEDETANTDDSYDAMLSVLETGNDTETNSGQQSAENVNRVVVSLQHQLKEAVAQSNQRVASLSADHQAEVDEVRRVHEIELAEAKTTLSAIHEKKISKLQAEHQAKMLELESRIETESDLKELVKELQNQLEYTQETVSDMQQEELKLKEEISTLSTYHLKETAEARSAHEKELASLKASLSDCSQKRVLELRIEYDASLASMERKYAESANTVEKLQNQLADSETEVAELRESKARLQRRDEEVLAYHCEEIEKLQNSHERELAAAEASLSAGHREEIEHLRDQFEVELSGVRDKHDAVAESYERIASEMNRTIEQLQIELSRSRRNEGVLEDKVAGLTTTHRTEIRELRCSHQSGIISLRASLSASHQEEINALKDEHLSEISSLKRTYDAALSVHGEDKDEMVNTIESLRSQISESEVSSSKKARKSESELKNIVEHLSASHQAEIEEIQSSCQHRIVAMQASLSASNREEISRIKEEDGSEIFALKKKYHEAVKLQEESKISANHMISQMQNELVASESTYAREKEMMRTQLEERVTSLSESHRTLTEELQKSHKIELVSLQASLSAGHQEEVSGLLDSHKAALSILESKREEDFKDYERSKECSIKRIESLQTELSAVEEASSAELNKIKAEFEERVTSLSACHRVEIEELKLTYHKALESMQKSVSDMHQKELSDLQDDHNEKLSQMRSKYDDVIRKLEHSLSETNQKVELIRHDLLASEAALTSQRRQAEADMDTRVASLKKVHQTELRKLQEAHDVLQEQLEDVLATKEEAIDETKEVMDALRADLSLAESLRVTEACNAKMEAENRISTVTAESHAEIDRVRDEHKVDLLILQTELEKAKKVSNEQNKKIDALEAQLSVSEAAAVKKLAETAAEFAESSEASSKRRRIEVEQLLADSQAKIGELEAKVASVEEDSVAAVNEKVAEIERLRKRLSESTASNATLKNEIERLRKEFEEELATLERKLRERESTIADLERDMSSQMEKLMASSSSLQLLQDECGLVDSLSTDIEVLEHERTKLMDVLLEKDTNIAELSAEILKLEIEKELLEQNTSKTEAARVDVIELEKENLRLKDKIERQEAFMKQKLEKERAQRKRFLFSGK